MTFKIGDRVIKTKGIPFGGVPCKNCGHTEFAVINGSVDNGRRVTAKHPEGWSHIFDPDQLELAARPEAVPGVVEAAANLLAAIDEMHPAGEFSPEAIDAAIAFGVRTEELRAALKGPSDRARR